MKTTKEQYKLIFGYLGIFLVLVGLICLLPLFLLLFYQNESKYFYAFLIPGIISIAGGCALMFFLLNRSKKIRLGKHQDSVLLVLIWLSSIVICSLPFLLCGQMNFTESIFETTSGFSTIGLTVLPLNNFIDSVDSDTVNHLLIFWRSVLTLLGGVGLVLVVTTVLSDKFKLNLYTAEGHNDKLLPNLKKSALVIFGIYLGLILVGTVAYSIVFYLSKPVSTKDVVFEALVHSISAVATGGFSSRAGGLVAIEEFYGNGSFNSIIEIISIFLMLAGSINFLTHLFVLTGKFKKVWKDCEFKFLAFALATVIPIFFITTLVGSEFNGFQSFRHGAFTFISAITTTGFSTVSSIESLGFATLFLIVLVNIIGGGAGSTAGGVKQYRVVVAAKSFFWSARQRAGSSRMIYPTFVNRSGEDKEITRDDALEAYGYIVIYIVLMFAGGLLISLFANDSFDRTLFEFSNAISSTGLSNGITFNACTNGLTKSCNFGVLWTLIVGMFAGRLEILPIYFAFYRGIRDIFGKETN